MDSTGDESVRQEDFKKFKDGLHGVYSFYGKDLLPFALDVWWGALKRFELPEVIEAFNQHLVSQASGQFLPKPADILKQLGAEDRDGARLGSSEAWAIAISAYDEAATVMLNDEIVEAMDIARPVLDAGDEIGARAAFREAYDRIVLRNRSACRPVKWWPSLGHDVTRREEVIRSAVDRGLLTQEQANPYLPAPVTPQGEFIAGLLTGNVVQMPNDPEFRKRISGLKAMLKGGKAA